MKILFIWPNKDAFGYKPIAISLFSAIAKARGWDVKLFDTTEIDFGFIDNTSHGEVAKVFKPVDMTPYGHKKKAVNLSQRVRKVLQTFSPDCIACSVLNDERAIALEICKTAKQWNSDIPIIRGNKYPTLKPEEILKDDAIDFVCLGEGIDAFEEFLSSMEGKRDPFLIPNIWAKKIARSSRIPYALFEETLMIYLI